MTSDLLKTTKDEETSKKAPEDILRTEIHEGVDALERSVGSLFISGLSAGLDVGFSLLLMAAMSTAAEGKSTSTRLWSGSCAMSSRRPTSPTMPSARG